jgi:hypothetical protein
LFSKWPYQFINVFTTTSQCTGLPHLPPLPVRPVSDWKLTILILISCCSPVHRSSKNHSMRSLR